MRDSALSRAAGIRQAPSRPLPKDDVPVCAHCWWPVERVEDEWACRSCRKKPVSVVIYPGQVLLAKDKPWEAR